MANINLGPASTSTASATAVLAPASTPNFGNLYQGVNAIRCLTVGRQIPLNAVGDSAFLSLINVQAFAFLAAAANPFAFVFANPGTLIGGVFTAASVASTVLTLYSGPNTTGLALTAATTLASLTAAGSAANLVQVATAAAGAASGYFNPATWGVGETTGLGGAASYGIYFHVSTASGVANSVCDLFVYGVDLT